MTTATLTASPPHQDGWFRRSERWLDERGKGAWIVAMVLGFIIFWPVGLALLAYMIWRKRMFNGSCRTRTQARVAFSSTGNNAFDAYKSDTLRRLQDEQDSFEAFLQRLRDAKDKAEFDHFMDDREAKSPESAEKENA
ncbi:DUF2852 domain-containing protein [Rhodobacteraceae bacterium]|nr:DUF2852 domain-containing protein [Paracoccaceae bacterium]